MPLFRLLRIAFEALRFLVGGALRRLHWYRSSPGEPERLRLGLARLGTTFIIEQALSMRQNMLPDEYVAALQSLQDHTTPFPAEKAIREIKRGLGRAVGELLAAEIFNQGQRGPAHRYL
jgi:ubiquinone biosynthesis protein